MWISTNTCTAYICIHMYMYKHTHTSGHSSSRRNGVYTLMYHIHINMYQYVHGLDTYVQINIYMYYIYMHTHEHTHTHTHTHTYQQPQQQQAKRWKQLQHRTPGERRPICPSSQQSVLYWYKWNICYFWCWIYSIIQSSSSKLSKSLKYVKGPSSSKVSSQFVVRHSSRRCINKDFDVFKGLPLRDFLWHILLWRI